MGVLERNLFDVSRPLTHVKVQFGQSTYWVEYHRTPHPYGEILTELLNCDAAPYGHTIAVLKQVMEEKDAQAAPREALAEYILGPEGKENLAFMQEQAETVRFIQERYSGFLTEAIRRTTFERKKGQKKIPLAQQIHENHMSASVSGVSLGKSRKADAPQVNLQYAVLEIDEQHHELVEKLYFDRLAGGLHLCGADAGPAAGICPQAVRQLRTLVFADAGRQLQLL